MNGRAMVFSKGTAEVRETRYAYTAPVEEKTGLIKRAAKPATITLKDGGVITPDGPAWDATQRKAGDGETINLYRTERGTYKPVRIEKEVPDDEGWMSEILDEDTLRTIRKTTIQTERLSKNNLKRIMEAATPIIGMVLLIGAVVLVLYFVGDYSVSRAAAIAGEAKKSTLLNATQNFVSGGAS